jgi:hypothetical protein
MHTFANMKHEHGIKVSSAARKLGATRHKLSFLNSRMPQPQRKGVTGNESHNADL